MRTDAEAKEQIIQVVRELFDMGQLTPTGGNVSARGASDDLIWITPSQMYKGALRAEDLVCIREDGERVEGTNRPSVEFQMHWQAYRARPEEALEATAREAGGVALVITDLTLPGMSGTDLGQALRARGEAVPVIVLSGYPPAGAAGDAIAAWLQKPLEVEELLAAVRRALKRPAPR